MRHPGAQMGKTEVEVEEKREEQRSQRKHPCLVFSNILPAHRGGPRLAVINVEMHGSLVLCSWLLTIKHQPKSVAQISKVDVKMNLSRNLSPAVFMWVILKDSGKNGHLFPWQRPIL